MVEGSWEGRSWTEDAVKTRRNTRSSVSEERMIKVHLPPRHFADAAEAQPYGCIIEGGRGDRSMRPACAKIYV